MLRWKALTFEGTGLANFKLHVIGSKISCFTQLHNCTAIMSRDTTGSATQSDRSYENNLMSRTWRNFDAPDDRIYPAYKAVPVFKISVHALLRKTPKSIVQVGGNRYLRLMDTGNCGWWAQRAEIHIDTDITGQWAPRGREEVTGCFDSLDPLNGKPIDWIGKKLLRLRCNWEAQSLRMPALG